MDRPVPTPPAQLLRGSRRRFLGGSGALALGAVSPALSLKDNVIFGVRAVGRDGHRSPAVFPFPAE